MFKKIILTAFFYCLSFYLFAQKDSLLNHHLKVYRNALKYNDPTMAMSALHGVIAIDSNSVYKDTLSMLYFARKSYYSALVLAEEVVRKDQSKLEAFGRAAECYQMLGEFKTAIQYYEQISAITKNPYYYYQLAVSQYSLKRMGESEENCKKVMTDTISAKIGVAFMNSDGSEQAVPVHTAAKNLLGVIQMDAKNYAEAARLFKEALTLFPQFAGASENLKAAEGAVVKEKKK
ncbi:MAG: tetratricopeptide repeat protein [Bacteroidota bacterium]|jgi:tetratricopeptide (TPR) repeat protein